MSIRWPTTGCASVSDLDKQRRLVEACKSAIQKIESGAHFDWFVRDKLLKELKEAVEAAEKPPSPD